MSSRAEQKARAREARLAAERAAQADAARRRRMILFGGILALAAVIAVVAVIVSQSGDEEGATTAENVALFDGIPQEGSRLGRATAPVVVEEYADLQCPFCAQFSKDRLPPIVRDYVRSGEVQLTMRLVSILGPDSATAARFAIATGRQNRLWQFTEAFFADQGQEGTGYVTEDFLRGIAEQVPGLDIERAFADARRGDVADELSEAQSAFTRYGLTGTPSFRVGPRGGDMKTVTGEQLPSEIAAALESAAKAGRA